jgi:Uma2 family endonuclease
MTVSSLLKKEYTDEDLPYYYDLHETEEDLMGDSVPQTKLIVYLMNLLEFYYQKEGWFIGANINIYPPIPNLKTHPIEPDVAVFKGAILSKREKGRLRSWKMLLANRPAPSVVFKISSDTTWKRDLVEKPEQYRSIGVKEYFAYDPNEPPYWKERLKGWRYNDGAVVEMIKDVRGWLWSEELNSWLVPDSFYLRLYDREGNQRLTEAEHLQKLQEIESLKFEKLKARLRELGEDPDKLI